MTGGIAQRNRRCAEKRCGRGIAKEKGTKAEGQVGGWAGVRYKEQMHVQEPLTPACMTGLARSSLERLSTFGVVVVGVSCAQMIGWWRIRSAEIDHAAV